MTTQAPTQVTLPDFDLAANPLRFVAYCWPEMKLYDKQVEILDSVRDHPETFVHAANQTGKTRIAAVTSLWFFCTRTPSRVILTSSSERQLNSVLWNEILGLASSSRLPLPIVKTTRCIQKVVHGAPGQTEPLDYLIGLVPRQVESFQGHHLPTDKPRVLVVFEESSGIADEFFDAAASFAHRKLVIGNPLSTTNFFYRCCRAGDQTISASRDKLFRKVIHIDGRDSPNVQLGMRWKAEGRSGEPPVIVPGLLIYDDFVHRKQTWDEVNCTTRLYGQFYEGEHAMLFPAAWLNAAMDPQRWGELCCAPRSARAMGVDVAAGGRDNTCWTLIDERGVIEQIVLDISDTTQIVGRTIELMSEHRLAPHAVVFDAGGGGKQLTDQLRAKGHPVHLVSFGESAEAMQSHTNRRAELYGNLRPLLDPAREQGVFALPPDADQLRSELAVLPTQYDAEGRMCLPPKRGRPGAAPGELSIAKLLGGRSPDRADSLVLAVCGLQRWRRYPDHSDHVYYLEDDSELTPKEVAELPEEFRELYEMETDPSLGRWRRDDDLWD